MKTIIIKVGNERVELSPETFVYSNKTNIPKDHMSFITTRPIFWEVEMLSFKRESAELQLRVINYKSTDHEGFAKQNPKYEISQLRFEPFVWDKLQPLLSTYQKGRLTNMILDVSQAAMTPHKTKIQVKVPLAKLTFGMGYISFHKDYPWRRPETEFRIPHPDSIPEYEHIKFYFKSILGKGTIDVELDVVSTTTETKLESISSRDLSKIDAKAIQVLKVRKMDEWTSKKPKLVAPDQSLFTFEDAMESYGDEALGNIDILEKDLLFHLIEKESVRNSLQLRYLSEEIHLKDHKLYMTLVPRFGFVFKHTGAEMTHYIWELINSHATYIWSIPHNTSQDHIEAIENEIRSISVHGRQVYKTSFEPQEHLFFHSLRHRTRNFSYEKYFARWKKNLDNLLI